MVITGFSGDYRAGCDFADSVLGNFAWDLQLQLAPRKDRLSVFKFRVSRSLAPDFRSFEAVAGALERRVSIETGRKVVCRTFSAI